MSFACIGWGSLVWQPRQLPLASEWFHDGPVLPLEFARHSGQKTGEDRLTLVALSSGAPVRTRWAKLDVANLEEARKALRVREGTKLDDIGYCPGSPTFAFGETIATWASGKGIEGVVWTALPPKFKGEEGRIPTVEEALDFLSGLSGKPGALAEEYIRKAPMVVRTPYRETFERELGWSPLSQE